MSATTPPGYFVTTSPYIAKVHTMRGIQHHRGHRAVVQQQGSRDLVRCTCVHKKPSGALDHGRSMAWAAYRAAKAEVSA